MRETARQLMNWLITSILCRDKKESEDRIRPQEMWEDNKGVNKNKHLEMPGVRARDKAVNGPPITIEVVEHLRIIKVVEHLDVCTTTIMTGQETFPRGITTIKEVVVAELRHFDKETELEGLVYNGLIKFDLEETLEIKQVSDNNEEIIGRMSIIKKKTIKNKTIFKIPKEWMMKLR